MRVTVTEPVRAERVEFEVLVPAPSGHPADMVLGEVAVNHRPFVERQIIDSHPIKVTNRTINPDGTVTEVVTEQNEEVVVGVEMVPPPPWRTSFAMPVAEPRELAPGTYEVTIVDVDVEVEPAGEIQVPNPDYVEPVYGTTTETERTTSPDGTVREVVTETPAVLVEGTPDLPKTMIEVVPAKYATRQQAVLEEVTA